VEGVAVMAFDLHVFIDRDGRPCASATLEDGTHTLSADLTRGEYAELKDILSLVQAVSQVRRSENARIDGSATAPVTCPDDAAGQR